MKNRMVVVSAVVAALGLTVLVGCSKSGGSGGNGAQAVTIQLSPPTGSTLPGAMTGTVYSQTFTVLSGGTAPYAFGGIGIPAGMSIVQLTNNAAALAGTPTQSGTGIVQFGIVDAANASVTFDYLLTITGGTNTLTVNPATLSGTFVAGQPFSNSLTTTGTPPITWSRTGTLPPGITLGTSQATTNSLSGTFTQAGSFSFTLNTQDSTGATGTRTYNVTIN